jgi:hypothetical protein
VAERPCFHIGAVERNAESGVIEAARPGRRSVQSVPGERGKMIMSCFDTPSQELAAYSS